MSNRTTMEARTHRPESDVRVVAYLTVAACVMLTIFLLLGYFFVSNYNPTLSCSELERDAYTMGRPPKVDDWDDYELICW